MDFNLKSLMWNCKKAFSNIEIYKANLLFYYENEKEDMEKILEFCDFDENGFKNKILDVIDKAKRENVIPLPFPN